MKFDPLEVVPVLNLPSNERIDNLKILFYEEYGCNAVFYARVPGRVNIIGEHIDYSGFPVLPMAIEQDIIIAVGLIKESDLHVRNINKKYEDFMTSIKKFNEIEIYPDSNGKPYWYNYVLCGIKGALQYLDDKFTYGVQFLVDGTIPPASGLSSSSALVSAACLAFLHAQGIQINKVEIAELCAKCERYIGTQGGGMDQAIAFLSQKNCAQYITFNPLKAQPVSLPEDIAFVIAHSLAEANKAATNHFNCRVVECRISAKIISKNLSDNSDSSVYTLGNLYESLHVPLAVMPREVNKILDKYSYNKAEICKLLEISEEELIKRYMTPDTQYFEDLKLCERALHVYREAMRVEEFRRICNEGLKYGSITIDEEKSFLYMLKDNKKPDPSCLYDNLGRLMYNSHQSLDDLYECSHENLNRLVGLSKDNGVYARLTGAGWGGCIIAIVPKTRVEEYINILKDNFYSKYFNINKKAADKYVFVTTPNDGACVYVENNS